MIEINVCIFNVLDNFLKAKAMCAKAEYTSDLNSDMEVKRQIKKKRFFDEESSEENITEVDCNSDFVHKTSSTKETSILSLSCLKLLFYIFNYICTVL